MGVILDVLKTAFAWLIGLIDKLLPSLGLPQEFLTALDNAAVFLIGMLEGVSFFIPLDIFVMCLTAMIIVDNFGLLFKVGKWIVEFVGGLF